MPAPFFIEIVGRAVFVFVLIIFCMRLMGKRMAAHLNRNELVALSSLAAAIGIPLQAPDRGLLPAFVVAMAVVGSQRLIAAIAARNGGFENLTQGHMTMLLKDGYLLEGGLREARISRDRLLAELRSKGFKHTGQVSRIYFEASGALTIIGASPEQPGLSILPMEDPSYHSRQHYLQQEVCAYCGKQREEEALECSNCKRHHFTPAVGE
jgi:uncharacterized membrane protein YcaP (DUF421 family)